MLLIMLFGYCNMFIFPLKQDIPVGVTHDELDPVQHIGVDCQSNHP